MIASRWISRTLLVLMLGSVLAGLTARASVKAGGDPIAGVDGRVVVEPEQLAAWKLERLGARLRYDESKFGRSVIEVDLSGLPVSDEVLKELLPLRRLRRLSLRGTRVTDKGLQTLAKIQSLRQLDLRKTRVSLIDNILKLEKAVPKLSIDHDSQWGCLVPSPAVAP